MNVQAPDGKIISFPDGMSPADIDAAMQQYHDSVQPAGVTAPRPDVTPQPAASAAPMNALERVPLGLLASGARGALVGAGAPGDLESLAMRYVGNPIERYMGEAPSDPSNTLFPKSSDMLSLVPGLENALTGSLAPQNEWERMGQTVMGGATSAVPLALLTGGTGAPAMIAGGMGGAAGEGARALGAPEPVQLAAGLAAGLGVNAIGAGQRTLLDVAKDLGSSRSLDAAGAALKESAEDWRTNVFPQQMADANAKIDAAIPAATPHLPNDLLDRSEELLARGGAAADAVNTFLDKTAKSGGALGATAKQLQGDLANRQLVGGNPASPITWDAGRKFRSELGLAMRNSRNEADHDALAYLYGGTTNDLGQTASTLGAGDLFNDYNTISTNLHALDNGPIKKIINAPTGGEAANRLRMTAKKSGDELGALRAGGGMLPDAVSELGAADLSLNPDGRSFARYSPEAQAHLVPDEADRAVVLNTSPKKGEPGITNKLLESIRGSELVGSGAELAGTALGLPPRVSRAAGEFAGSLTPWAWRQTKNALTNPLVPASGVIGASTVQPAMQYRWPAQ